MSQLKKLKQDLEDYVHDLNIYYYFLGEIQQNFRAFKNTRDYKILKQYYKEDGFKYPGRRKLQKYLLDMIEYTKSKIENIEQKIKDEEKIDENFSEEFATTDTDPLLDFTDSVDIKIEYDLDDEDIEDLTFIDDDAVIDVDSSVNITIEIYIESPQKWEERKINTTANKGTLISELISNSTYAHDTSYHIGTIRITDINIYPNDTEEGDFDEIEPQEFIPKEIEWLGNSIDKNHSKNNCLQNYLSNVWKTAINKSKPMKKEIEEIKTIKHLKTFVEKYDVKCKIYDIHECVYNNRKKTSKRSKNKLNSIAFVLHDNHVYPIKGKLITKDPKYDEYRYSDNIVRDLIQHIEKSNTFTTVHASDNMINAFHVKEGKRNICYTSNMESECCFDIMKHFGLEEHMSHEVTPYTLVNIIMSFTNEKYRNIKSNAPHMSSFKVPGYNYINDRLVHEAKNNNIKYCDMDKNKCYMDEFQKLPFLISHDIFKHKVINNPKEIIEHYMYCIKVKKSTIHCHTKYAYLPGYALNKMKKCKIRHKIIHGLETDKHENIFKPLIKKLAVLMKERKDLEGIIKLAINSFIGKMAKVPKKKLNTKFIGIFNKEQARTKEGTKVSLKSDKYFACYEEDDRRFDKYTMSYMKNMKPVEIQIKYGARMLMNDTIKKLKLDPNKIIQIKTDSIVTSETVDFDELNLGFEIDQWKIQSDTKFLKSAKKYKESCTPYYSIKNDNEMNLGYAGCGKTYTILNKVLPKYPDAVVLSPSHCALLEYKRACSNGNFVDCETTQNFSVNGRVPKDDTIIVDEIGLVGKKGWLMLQMCAYLGKKLICFGDFQQLLPYGVTKTIYTNHRQQIVEGSPIYNENIKTLMFRHETYNCQNRRNKFSNEYYDSLINNTTNIKDEVIKYSTKSFKDAQYIVCYRNKTVDRYNEAMLKINKLKSIHDVGAKIVCTSNKYVHKMGFPNSSFFTVVGHTNMLSTIRANAKRKEKHVTIEDENGEKYNIPLVDFHKKGNKNENKKIPNFKAAYAVTLHRLQGQTISSYYFPKDDYKKITPLPGDYNLTIKDKCRFAYTLISRIKK